MAHSDKRNSQTDLSDWALVEKALSKKHSRERRLQAATDLLYDVDTAIRLHEHEHRRLMDAGETVMPEESVAYGDGLRHVKSSGAFEPSAEDREVTRRLREAGDVLGIPVLDHFVFSWKDYYSFLENNAL